MSMAMSVNRREFLEQVAAWTAGVSLAAPLFHIGAASARAAAGASTLAVATGKDYTRLVSMVLEPLGGMKAFVKPGQTVVVKPNIGWDRTPEQAANTHPAVVGALVKLALEAGAKSVSVFDRTCNNNRMTYRKSGIFEAVESVGDRRASCPFIDDKRWVPVQIKNATALSEWPLYRDALEADVYINVPIAKHHGLAKLTLGMKNIMGVIGGNRGQIHQNMGQKLAELNTVVKPALTVIDATRILLRHGPQGGNLEDVKVLDSLIASADVVAADAYATTLFGMEPNAIESTVAGAAIGLGEMDLSKVNVKKVA